jgi:hypothetical protein
VIKDKLSVCALAAAILNRRKGKRRRCGAPQRELTSRRAFLAILF